MAKKYTRPPRRPTRKPAMRDERQCILIVCEGEKTEVNYFIKLKQTLRLTSVDIKIEHRDTAALRVVKYAKQLKEGRENSLFSAYDKIWCVVDVEYPPQTSLDQAVIYAIEHQIDLIMSNPCFEYWLILHFEKTCSHMTAKQALERLKKRLPGYSKNDISWFDEIYQNTRKAIKHAKAILKENKWETESLKNCNSATHVQKIVEYLIQTK